MPDDPIAKDPKPHVRPPPGPQPPTAKTGPHAPEPVDTSDESVAGEEDPGASIDVDVGGNAPTQTPGEKR